MTRAVDDPQPGAQCLLLAIEPPPVLGREVVREIRAVGIVLRRRPLVGVAMNLRAREVAQAARVIEVQVAQHDRVDVGRRDADPRQQHRQTIVSGHLRRAEREPARAVVAFAQRGVRDLPVVAADVVQHAAVRGFDQVREDRRLDRRPVRLAVQRQAGVVAVAAGQDRNQPPDVAHARRTKPEPA